jgi:hypothetical protein
LIPLSAGGEELLHLFLAEGIAFRGALDLHEGAVAGLDHVQVDVGGRVLVVGEVETHLLAHLARVVGHDPA